MEVQLSLDDDDPEALGSLQDVLLAEPELRGKVRAPVRAHGSETMGAISDVLVVAAGGGGALTVLAGALKVWLSTRRSNVRVTMQLPRGRKIIVTATNVADPTAFTREVLAQEAADEPRPT